MRNFKYSIELYIWTFDFNEDFFAVVIILLGLSIIQI